MSKFIINGGKSLSGKWPVQGMKNAATPILAATLLTDEKCTIHNVPRISDVEQMLNILKMLGSEFEWSGDNTVTIQTKNINTDNIDYKAFKRMRSSVLFIGPLLARLGKFTILEPGGCVIGNRPLTTHFKALRAYGAGITEKVDNKDVYYNIFSDKLQGSNFALEEKSVTGTENAMMAACLISGKTTIKNVAQEPHVVSLGKFLRKMGANISGEGTGEISIQGVESLSGAEFEVIPDQLEVGTIAVLGALCGGEIEISPIVSTDMTAVADKLKEAGVDFKEDNNSWIVKGSKEKLKSFKIETAPFPGFPTDLQSPFGVLATQSGGQSVIYDPMFENRLGYINELKKMGAKAEIKDAHTAVVAGPSKLLGTKLNSLDLRAGATLIIAALLAKGQTTLHEAQIIDRGYERIDQRLGTLGADIKRIK